MSRRRQENYGRKRRSNIKERGKENICVRTERKGKEEEYSRQTTRERRKRKEKEERKKGTMRKRRSGKGIWRT